MKRWALLSTVIFFAHVAIVHSANAAVTAVHSTSIVMPPDAMVQGQSASDLSVDWWKWAKSRFDKTNPVKDMTGKYCDVGQSGDVWFLAGGFGSAKIRRTCTVPSGKYIFFPAVNMAYWRQKDDKTYTCEQAQINASVNNDAALELFVEVDGLTLANPRQHRARSTECFNVYERVPKKYNVYDAFPSASDGYWYLLKPMKKGVHTIKFGGRYRGDRTPYGRMVQDIEYSITVE